jgi:hypothetical protein
MTNTDPANPRVDVHDANWASMYLFGRWGWDGYLFGADQSGVMLDSIDATYTYGFDRRKDLNGGADEGSIYNFGGYPGAYYSSAYNAGYGSTALRGEEYRDEGIEAYEWMINHSQSAPYSWWESDADPDSNSPWDIAHSPDGGGSSPHMWGQSVASKVLWDSLIALKSDGSVIIGRGVPTNWITDGATPISISNYPVNNGTPNTDKRMGYTMKRTGDVVSVDFSGDNSTTPASIQLMALENNIYSVTVDGQTVTDPAGRSGITFDAASGTVNVPAGAKDVEINMKAPAPSVDKTALNNAISQATALVASQYTPASFAGIADPLAAAQQVSADDSATQAQVDSATAALNAAIAALVPAESGSTPTPNTPSGSGGQSETPTPSGSGGGSGHALPATGGQAGGVVPLALLFVGSAAALLARKQRRSLRR